MDLVPPLQIAGAAAPPPSAGRGRGGSFQSLEAKLDALQRSVSEIPTNFTTLANYQRSLLSEVAEATKSKTDFKPSHPPKF